MNKLFSYGYDPGRGVNSQSSGLSSSSRSSPQGGSSPPNSSEILLFRELAGPWKLRLLIIVGVVYFPEVDVKLFPGAPAHCPTDWVALV